MDTVTFLGTGGARVMVAQQVVASGGMWLNLGGTEILFDPGPGCIVQATKRKLNPRKLAAIYLSHKHLDHSGDINVMIEAMTEGGLRRRGLVFAPRDALEEDPVILRYLRPFLEGIVILEEGKTYRVGDVTLETPLRHQHSVETYGAIFSTAEHTFSCIVDTRYFEALTQAYRGELVIMNVVRLDPSPYDHLSVPDARKIIAALRPRVAVLTHFGMTVWRARPWDVAKQLAAETGVRVIAARDGMTLELNDE